MPAEGQGRGEAKAGTFFKPVIETVYCAPLLPQNALHVHNHWPNNVGYLSHDTRCLVTDSRLKSFGY